MVNIVPKRCLICCGDSSSKKTGTQEANPTSLPSAENFNGQQADGIDNGDTELQIIFLLRKLLEIPESTCCKMRDHFGNASVWIECCDSCLDLVEKCKAALEQAELFQKQYEELRSNIKTTMLKSPKKPFSAESKCEAIVRSHLITQEIDNFIGTNGSETAEENFPDGNFNCEPDNSPLSVGSQNSEDSQVLSDMESITPVLIDSINTVKNEDDIIISFNTVTENFINITDTVADTEIFQNITGAFNQNTLKAQVIPPETTVTVLPESIIPVMFERINTVKDEDETLNENDLDLKLESSDFGSNIQSGYTPGCEENNCETIQLDNLSESAKDDLDQLVLPGQSNKSRPGSKSSPYTSEEPRVSKRGDRGVVKRIHKCHKCLQLFKVPQELRTHLRSHSGSHKNTFRKRKGNLREHPRKHTGEKKHECDICGKSFRKSYRLKVHGRIHSGEKPFVCDICGKAFAEACNLNRHFKEHSGERNFECDVCGKAFMRKDHLKDHQATHSQKKPFKCDICNKSFKSKCNLSRHRKMHDEEAS